MGIDTLSKLYGSGVPAAARYQEDGEELTHDNEHGSELDELARAVRSGLEDYYFKPGSDTILTQFVGSGAEHLGLGLEPQKGDYAKLMYGINPRTDEPFMSAGRQKQVMEDRALAGYSTSYNVDKTLSLLYASMPRDKQVIFERAVLEATRRTTEYREAQGHYSYRMGTDGKDGPFPGRVITAQYLHFTSRGLDPHIHVHIEIPNGVFDENGKWRALEGYEIFARQIESAAICDGFLAEILQRDMPEIGKFLESDIDAKGLRVAGISRETVLKFSSRRVEILKKLHANGFSGAAAAEKVSKATRADKGQIDAELVRESWRLALAELNSEIQPGRREPITLLHAEQLVFTNRSVFEARDLERAAAQMAVMHGGPQRIEAIKASLIEQLGVIELPQQPGGQRLFTTENFRAMEGDLLSYALRAQEPVKRFALSHEDVGAAIDRLEAKKGWKLKEEQRQAVFHCATGSQFSIIQGAAGTGKSVSLEALRDAYETAGMRVLGLAPSGAAAAELESSASINSRTIHALLTRLEEPNPQYRQKLTENDVIIVDEAGLADLRTLHKLASFCDQSGAKLVLVGDSRQLESVGSASVLANLTEAVGASRLVEIARQYSDEDRAISKRWFAVPEDGEVDALQMMRERGLLRGPGGAPSKEEVEAARIFVGPPAPPVPQLSSIDAMMRDVRATHEAGAPWRQLLLLADRNAQVDELNARVREYRKEIGELNPAEEVEIGAVRSNGAPTTLKLCPGDRIMLREGAKIGAGKTQVFNGDRATVTAIRTVETGIDENGTPTHDFQITAELDRGVFVTWLASDYKAVNHAAAMTVHKSQGLTVDHAFYKASHGTDRHLMYVAVTRSRYACPVYIDDLEAQAALARNTANFSAKTTALDADRAYAADVIATGGKGGGWTQQVSTQTLLARAGERFQPPAEEHAAPKELPKIEVMQAAEGAADMARERGYAVTELIDKPDDTRSKPGKPYVVPEGATKVAVIAELLPEPPKPKQKESQHEQRSGRSPELNPDQLKRVERPGPERAERPEQRGELGADRVVERSERSGAGGTERGTERAEPAAGSLGKFDRIDPAKRAAIDTSNFVRHDVADAEWLERTNPADGLRDLSESRMAPAADGRRASLLPGHARAGDRNHPGMRRDSPVSETMPTKREKPKFDPAERQRETQQFRRETNINDFAGTLGWQFDQDLTIKTHGRKFAAGDEKAVLTKNGEKLHTYVGKDGNPAFWNPQSGAGGDVYALYRHENPNSSFLDAKKAVEAFNGGSRLVSPGTRTGPTPDEQAAKAAAQAEKAAKAQAELELSTALARGELAGMHRQGSDYLKGRGLTDQTLAETRWKTGEYGNAAFTHVGPDGQACGYEYRGELAKGYASGCQKGIYVANVDTKNKTEIMLCEGGVDTMSAYQMATPAERARTLFVGTAGNPGPNTDAALKALAESHNIEKIRVAYNRDKGGDALTEKRIAAIKETMPNIEVSDVRNEVGLLQGEDMNAMLARQRADRDKSAEAQTERTRQDKPADHGQTQPQQDEPQQEMDGQGQKR